VAFVPVDDGRDPTTRASLSIPVLVLYGLPGMSVNFLFSLVLVMYMKFSTDVLLLAPSAIGAIFFASKIWDAISDPLAGRLSDRTHSRLGRRKAWLLASAIPLAITGVAMWAPPPGLGQTAMLIWIGVSVFAFYTAYTLFEVPHMALGAELSFDPRDRNRVFGARQLLRTFGLLAAFGIGVAVLEDPAQARANALYLALAAGSFTIGTILLAVTSLPQERPDFAGRGGASLRSAMRDVLHNPHARLLLFVFFIEQLGIGGIGVLVPYVAHYVMLRPDLTSEMLMVYVLCAVSSIPIWVCLGDRFDKRTLWLGAMWLSMLGFGLLLFLGPGTIGIMVVASILAGIGSGCGPTLGQAIKADVIDWDEYQTGERKEGAYFAAWSFTSKLAAGVMLGIVGFALDWSGFVENQTQSVRVEATMLALMGGMPVLGFGLGILAFRRFSLGPEEHARIRADIERGDTPGLKRCDAPSA